MRKFILSIVLVLASSSAHATLTPFTPVAGINPAVRAVKVVITVGTASQTLTEGSGLTNCSSTATVKTCKIATTNNLCPLPGGGTAACRQFGGFDIFPTGTTGQIAVLTETNTDSVQVRNLRVVNRGTATQIKIEASGNVTANVETTTKAHGMKMVGTFYRTVTQNDASKVSATAQLVASPSFPASVATVSGSYVYLKNGGTCTSNPVPANTTCQGGRTNYSSGSHTVAPGSLSNNGIKLGVPILILDTGVPSSTKCADAFSTGTDCQDVDHVRVVATFTLAKPTAIPSTNLTLKCTKPPCNTVDYVELVASAAGYSGQTEEIVFLGTGLVTEPHQTLNPGDQGFFTIKAFGNQEGVQDTSTCNCFDIFDSNNIVIVPGATFSPGKDGIPAKAVSCTRQGVDTNFKFDTPDTGFTCSDVPAASYVLKAVCTVNVTAEETTSDKKRIITTNVSGPIEGIVNGEGQIAITPCH